MAPMSKKLSQSVTVTQFKDEEVSSSLTYPEEYKGPKSIEEQIAVLAGIFNLNQTQAMAYSKKLPLLPDGAEGWFAVLSLFAAQKLCPEAENEAERHCRLLQLVHEKIATSRPFCNYREGQINTDHLKVYPIAENMKAIVEQQPGDILIIAAQLGMRHRGRSNRRSRMVFLQNEYGLTSINVGSIVLVHPERLVRLEELDMDCAGDEFYVDGCGRFRLAPYFKFYDNEVHFDSKPVFVTCDLYGTASGFVPSTGPQ